MKKEKNKGITLIALIITIVVMLILVAVTLSIALGENGIVNNAKKAARDTNSAMVNEANIDDNMTYGDVQGMDNIVEYLTNPREKVLAEDLEEGDKVEVKLKAVELNEEINGENTITFDNGMCIMTATVAPGAIDKNYIQLMYANYSGGILVPDISEQKPAYIYLTNGTNALGNSISKSSWYKTTDSSTLEIVTELPSFEATVERIGSDDSGIGYEKIDKVIDFYK